MMSWSGMDEDVVCELYSDGEGGGAAEIMGRVDATLLTLPRAKTRGRSFEMRLDLISSK